MMRRNHEDPPSPRELNTEIAEIPATMVLCHWARDRDARNGQMTAFVNDLRPVHLAAGGGRRPRGVAEPGQVITMHGNQHQDMVGPQACRARALVSAAGPMGGILRISGATKTLTLSRSGDCPTASCGSGLEITCGWRRWPWFSKMLEEAGC